MGRYLIISALIMLFVACGEQVEYVPLDNAAIVELPDARSAHENTRKGGCDDPLSYAPDTTRPEDMTIRRMRVNFHFVDRPDSCCNFSRERAESFAKEYLWAANSRLAENFKMHLPLGNTTPVLPILLRYELWTNPEDGKSIYFHYDRELYPYVHKGRHRNHYSREVINKYRVGGDSVLNVFILPHHPDSLRRDGYVPKIAGIALGTGIKVAGMVENGNVWDGVGIFNHEVGHVLGLRHSWAYSDGCEDTPHHPNCWNYTDSGPCDSLVSNNVMDYNAYQLAFTPCQIGKIHQAFSQSRSRQRRLLIEDWCRVDSSEAIWVRDTVRWTGRKDINHNVRIGEGGFLHIQCSAHFAEGTSITVEPGGGLLLDRTTLFNDCGDRWGGILVGKTRSRTGRVYAIDPWKINSLDVVRP